MSKTFKRIGVIIILFVAVQLVVQMFCMVTGLLPVIVNTLKHHPDEVAAVFRQNATNENLAVPLAVSTILSSSLTVFLFYKWKYVSFNFRKSFSVVPTPILLISVPLTFCAMFFLNALLEMLPLVDSNEQMFLAISKTGVWGFLATAIFAPVCEEFTFRGAIEGCLLKAVSPWNAIILSSLIFGIVHMNPMQIPFAFALGLLFGWLYYRTKSLLPGILAHFINNTVGFVSLAMSDKDEATIQHMLGKDLTFALMGLSVILFVILLFILNKKLKTIQ